MQERMTIGRLAKLVGVADSTIRHYEREGLLRPTGRSPGNYRVYGSEARDRLTFIRAAQAAGFELADIKSMLAFQDGRVTPCAEVRDLVRTRLADVRVRLGRLRHVEHVLVEFERACGRRPRAKACPVLQTLSPPARRRTRARSRRRPGP
jgi:DNA-binding transcriptional MerR regulator